MRSTCERNLQMATLDIAAPLLTRQTLRGAITPPSLTLRNADVPFFRTDHRVLAPCDR